MHSKEKSLCYSTASSYRVIFVSNVLSLFLIQYGNTSRSPLRFHSHRAGHDERKIRPGDHSCWINPFLGDIDFTLKHPSSW